MPQIKVYTFFDRPETIAEDVYQEIYEWEYIDENGKIKKDKKNVVEEIQSFLPRTDYKSQIERGELDLQNAGNTYTDFRGVPDGTVALYDYLNTLANLPQEQVAELLEQVNARNKESIQGKQGTNSEAVAGGQIVEKNVQGQSSNATIDTDNAGKSKETGKGE